jgi:hypothetical protein
MADVGYLQAWDAWGRHKLTQDLFLWHVQLFWWGRIGKMLQLLGALTVIAELIGYKRLDEFSASLRAGNLRRLPGTVRRTMTRFWSGYWQLLTRRGETRLSDLFSVLTMIGTTTALAVWIFGVVGGRGGSLEGAIQSGQLLALVIAVVVVIGPVLIFGPLVLAASLAWAFDLILLRPLARVLRGDIARWVVQISGLCLLIVGVQFDLLAG